MNEQINPTIDETANLQEFAAPNAEDLLIKGSVLENGRHLYQEENGQFMSKDRVIEISANAQSKLEISEQTALVESKELTVPNKDSLKVKSYLDAEGKPLIQNNELVAEIHSLVESGDRETLVKATEVFAQAALVEGKRLGKLEIMDNVKDFIDRSFEESFKLSIKNNTASEDEKNVVSTRYELLKSWGINAAHTGASNQEIFDELNNDNKWSKAQEYARKNGFLPAKPDVVAQGDVEPDLGAARVTDRGLNRPASLWGNGYTGRPTSNRDSEPTPDQPSTVVERDEDGNIIRHRAIDGMWAAPNAEDVVQADTDYFAAQLDQNDEQSSSRLSRWKRIRNALFTATPATIIEGFNARRQEQGDNPVSRKKLYALGGAAVAGVGLYAGYKAGVFDHALDNMNNLWEGNTGPKSTGSENLDAAGDLLGGNKSGSGSAATGSLEQAADILSGDAQSSGAEQLANVEVSTFTVEKPWSEGDPTLWSFVESQGVPEAQVDDLLNEWNPNWASIGQNMQVGDHYDIPIDLIEKYRLAAE